MADENTLATPEDDDEEEETQRQPEADPDEEDAESMQSTDFQGIDRLNKDLKKASLDLRPGEARYLVDTYYQQQQQRVRAKQRLTAAAKVGEPNSILNWDFCNVKRRENDIKVALGAFSASYRVGAWLQSLCGIGPVISAGLLAYLDIRQAKTVGHFWNFAGLNPDMVWLGKEPAKSLVAEIMGKGEKLTEASFQAVCTRANRHPENIRKMMREFTRAKLETVLAKRPWCARLKILTAFKAGECFIKTQNNERDFYGSIYRTRKDMELDKNFRKEFADQAARGMTRVKKSTEAYKYYKEGFLPPGHIHSRARRYAVKIFLSHVHAVMFNDYYGTQAPEPWCFKHLPEDHRHYIAPPDWPGEHVGRSTRTLLDG